MLQHLQPVHKSQKDGEGLNLEQFLGHLIEEIKPGGKEVVFAQVSKHWETVTDTKATQGNVWC